MLRGAYCSKALSGMALKVCCASLAKIRLGLELLMSGINLAE